MLSAFLRYIGFFTRTDFILPLFLIITYIIFLIVAKGVMPTSEELVVKFAELYGKYGYEIIFFAALLETLILINFVAPGQLAMALGVLFARSGQTELSLVIITAAGGSIAGYLIDYVLGQFGFSEILKKTGFENLLVTAKKQLRKFGKRGLIFGFVHSNVGSLLSLVAGAADISWKVFIPICVTATFFWLSLWAVIIYIFGDVILLLVSKYGYLLMGVVILGMILSRFWKQESNKRKIKKIV